MIIPVCPHCGESNTTLVNLRWYGWTAGSYDEEGEEIELGNDGLWVHMPKTVRCDRCSKIRRDLTTGDGKVVVKKVTNG